LSCWPVSYSERRGSQTSTKSQRKTENGCKARRGAESVQARLDLPFYLPSNGSGAGSAPADWYKCA
jgi:hypothetical protein